jgi:hypothetical protein
LNDSNMSIDRLWTEFNNPRRRPAPEATVEALAYQLRDGVGALRDQAALIRIAELNEQQVLELARRLTKERWGKCEAGNPPFKVRGWNEVEIETFLEIWKISQ